VFVGDAGAIPYVSALPALDGLGLGGFRALPFARASVHGVPAVIELVERLPEVDRPDVLAIYDGWWPGLVPQFSGGRLFAVKIDDNVICGGDEKVVHRADWSSLGPPAGAPDDPAVVDRLDVADLVDEREHGVELPGAEAGWIVAATRRLTGGASRFDAGRILPEGRALSFVVRESGREADRIALRTDRGGTLTIERSRSGPVELRASAPAEGAWAEPEVAVPPVVTGERIVLRATGGEARLFSVELRSRGPSRRRKRARSRRRCRTRALSGSRGPCRGSPGSATTRGDLRGTS
jgi:hypothetical protein